MKIFYPIICIIAVLLASCNTNAEPDNVLPTDVCYDFATIADLGASSTTFTLQKSGDSPLVTYIAGQNMKADTALHVGQRIIIMYAPISGGKPYESGPITLYGYGKTANTDQQVVYGDASTVDAYRRYYIKPVIVTRTGPYVNLQADLYCPNAQTPISLTLDVDSTTLAEEYIDAYVVFVPKEEGLNAFNAYASWDIAPLWERSTCKGVRLRYNTPTGPSLTTFAKTTFIPAQ